MLLKDCPVGSGYSEEAIVSHAIRSITVKQLVEGALFEVVKFYDGIFVRLMRECVD